MPGDTSAPYGLKKPRLPWQSPPQARPDHAVHFFTHKYQSRTLAAPGQIYRSMSHNGIFLTIHKKKDCEIQRFLLATMIGAWTILKNQNQSYNTGFFLGRPLRHFCYNNACWSLILAFYYPCAAFLISSGRASFFLCCYVTAPNAESSSICCRKILQVFYFQIHSNKRTVWLKKKMRISEIWRNKMDTS